MTDAERKPVYIVAEAGINHGGDMAIAREMITVAAHAGVDAVKFQSFTAAGLTHAKLAADQHEFFQRFELGEEEHAGLSELCRAAEVDFLSTPFDFRMVDLLATLGVPAFKIASCDLTFTPLIKHCASYGKPLYISTGMGNVAEARAAYLAAREAGSPRVVMLQCTTNYPTDYPDVNLRSMVTLKNTVGSPVGFSDHSIGNYACFGAVALGAEVIEKHFCLDKTGTGPDIPGSCSPDELIDLVTGIRALELCLGSSQKALRESEREISTIARRSIFYAHDMDAGHLLEPGDFVFLRPATGLSPSRVGELIGLPLAKAVLAGDLANIEDVGYFVSAP